MISTSSLYVVPFRTEESVPIARRLVQRKVLVNCVQETMNRTKSAAGLVTNPLIAIQMPLFTISPFCRNFLEVISYPGISLTEDPRFGVALPAGLTNFGTASCRK
jgi:hypothetical protein